MILLVLASISLVTDVFLASNFSRNMTTAIIILGMLLVSGIIRFIQEPRAKRVADRLTEMIASEVLVRRDGRWMELPADEPVVGDYVRLQAGNRIPADIRLLEAKDLFVSQSVITGESGILEKRATTLPPGKFRAYSQCHNLVFMGSSVMGGTGEGVVLAVGSDTVYGGFPRSQKRPKDGFDQGAHSIAWVLIRFMAVLIPFILMDAYRKQKKYKNFSIIVANTLFVLSAIKKTPGISTRESAEKLEVSERSVQRYIETLRIAGEWIEYDTALKGWKLSVGKSVLWDDF